MKLQYLEKIVSQNIDVEKLRPGKSYDFLIKNRNGDLTELINNKEKLKSFLVHRNCPLCGSNKNSSFERKDNLDIVQCDDCSTLFVNPIFDEKKYIELYKSNSYQEIVKKIGEDSHDYRKQRFGSERAEFINQHHDVNLPKSFLEIGCSTGFTLEALADKDWEVVGVELNPSAANFGRRRGLEIYNKTLDQVDIKKKFSAVALFDVLEHLVHPSEMINKIKEMMIPGGNIFVYVPNWNSATRELLGVQDSHFIWPTHHLTYFTPITLKNFLEKNQFDVFHWETQGIDLADLVWLYKEKGFNDVGFTESQMEALQFYINASGHGKNLRMFAKFKGE